MYTDWDIFVVSDFVSIPDSKPRFKEIWERLMGFDSILTVNIISIVPSPQQCSSTCSSLWPQRHCIAE
jgi:hypothetical protein